jgi:chromosome segregation ATPase
VDRKISDQLARRGELESLAATIEGIAAQTIDAQHKLEAVRTLEGQLVPLVEQLEALRTEVRTAGDQLKAVKYDEATIAEQEKQLSNLVAASRTAAAEVADHTRQLQGLSEDLARTTAIKNELGAELDHVLNRQREAVVQGQATEEQLTRAEKLFKALELRHAQLAAAQKKLIPIESKIGELKGLASEVERSLQAVNSKKKIVNSLKAEIEAVHQISARSKADLGYITEHRAEVAALKEGVDTLLARIAETNESMATIEARREAVAEVEAKAKTVVHLMEDVQINLDMLGEQKAVVDHVAEKAAQLDFVLQEARNTLRTLQHERELAERIERGIKKLRSKKAAPAEEPAQEAVDERRTA